MKKIITSIALLSFSLIFSQAYDGYGDTKTSVSVGIQNGGIGLTATWDKGVTDYISYGSSFGFMVKSEEVIEIKEVSEFDFLQQQQVIKTVATPVETRDLLSEKIDFNFRMDCHLGKAIGMGEMSDIYFGGRLAIRNLGAQLGFRYLLNDNFGFFAESFAPFYNFSLFEEDGKKNYLKYYEQPAVNFGLVFSM